LDTGSQQKLKPKYEIKQANKQASKSRKELCIQHYVKSRSTVVYMQQIILVTRLITYYHHQTTKYSKKDKTAGDSTAEPKLT
jgi:hypothetical protein